MKCVRYAPLRNTSITTLCAKSFYDAKTDAAVYTHAEKLFGDLWRSRVNWSVETIDGRTYASVDDAGGESWRYSHDYAIVALAGAAEMASGRRSFIGYGPCGVGPYEDCPTSMLQYELDSIKDKARQRP